MFEMSAPPPPLRRAVSPGAPGGAHRPGPPGWPDRVPPPQAQGWQMPAVGWLLDHCPSEYRLYAVWRRHPIALAWVTTHHLDAQLGAMRAAYRGLRVDLAGEVEPEGIAATLAALEAEGARLLAARRAAGLLLEAMQGHHFVPRL